MMSEETEQAAITADTIRTILSINAAIQHWDAQLMLDGKTVLCVALDSTCTFDDEEGTEILLTDDQIAKLKKQILKHSLIRYINQPTQEYKILGSRWFTNPSIALLFHRPDLDGVIGVVAVETHIDEWKAYIGVSYGHNRQTDEQNIARSGSGLSPKEAHGFFPCLDITKYKKG